MSKTNIRVTQEELEAIRASAAERWGQASRVSLGAHARYLSEKSIEESSDE